MPGPPINPRGYTNQTHKPVRPKGMAKPVRKPKVLFTNYKKPKPKPKPRVAAGPGKGIGTYRKVNHIKTPVRPTHVHIHVGRGGGGAGGLPNIPEGGLSGMGGDMSQYLINPEKFASAATNAQFRGPLGALHRQAVVQKAEEHQNLLDIANWFKAAQDAHATSQGQIRQSGTRAVREVGDASRGILQALGGSANPAAGLGAEYGQLGASTTAGIGQAADTSSSQLGAILAGAGVQAKTNEGRYQRRLAQEIAAKILDMQAQKGSAYTKNLFGAKEMGLRQQAGIQNMQIAGGMFGIQQQAGRLANQNTALQNKSLNKQYNQLYGKSSNALNTLFGEPLNAGERQKLGDAIKMQMFDPVSQKQISPLSAWSNVGDYLESLYGANYRPKNNKAVAQWLSNIWLPMAKRWNKVHNLKQVDIPKFRKRMGF